jgi:ATP-dependent RNA helicase SUPV3L1/SUV3
MRKPRRPHRTEAAQPAAPDLVAPADGADASARADGAAHDAGEAAAIESPAPAAAPKPAPKPVVAMRGDDRPSSKKTDSGARRTRRWQVRRPSRRRPAGPGGPGRPGDRGGPRPDARGDRGGDRGAPAGRFGDRPPRFEDRGPRLGDAAFRAQREALERADMALRKLAAQAHGEALTQVLGAWEQRDAARLPSVQELGRAVTPAVRTTWSQAVGSAPTAAASDAAEALLRLEMAAEVPTPAEQLDARRALQLKLLTKRGDPAPAQTWGQDAGKVLAAAHDAAQRTSPAERVEGAAAQVIARPP